MRAGSQEPERGVEGLMEENAKCMKGRFNGQGAASTCGGLPHPSGCTVSFPSVGPKIGAHHSQPGDGLDDKAGRAAMTGMFNLWDILAPVNLTC